MTIIIILICAIVVIGLVFLLCFLFYLDDIPSGSPVCISFNDFKTYYTLNPNRYDLYRTYVFISTSGSYRKCYFSFVDTFKYKKFRRDIDKKKIEASKNISYIKILEAVQQDIDALRKQSNQEIKEASDRAVEIAERLKE